MAEELVGKVNHFFPKISVAVVTLEGNLKVGDKIKVEGKEGPFEQTVGSMQIEHESLEEAKAGQEIGLKVEGEVREGASVFKITE